MKDKTIEELLDELQNLVDTLKGSLPKEAPLFFSSHIDPVRDLYLREACLHRVTELAESACDEFKKGNLVAGYVLTRAFMETFALFWYFVDKLRDALKDGDVKELREILTRMLLGVKPVDKQVKLKKVFEDVGEEVRKQLNPIHVLKLIEHVEKKLPSFRQLYDYLSEVTHPNAMGFIKAYVRLDWDEKMAYFGKEHGQLGSHLATDLEALTIWLEGYIGLYNESAELFKRFQELCVGLAVSKK